MALVSRLVSGGDIDLIVSMLRCFSAAHETKPFHVIIFSDQYRTSTNQFLPLESLSLSLSLAHWQTRDAYFFLAFRQTAHTSITHTTQYFSSYVALLPFFNVYFTPFWYFS